MSQIRDLIFSNGERYPVLMEENGSPNYWVTLYVTERLYLPKKSRQLFKISYSTLKILLIKLSC